MDRALADLVELGQIACDRQSRRGNDLPGLSMHGTRQDHELRQVPAGFLADAFFDEEYMGSDSIKPKVKP